MFDSVALDSLPAVHPQTLVVKAVGEGSSPLAAAWSAQEPLLQAVSANGGLARLGWLERSGEIASAVPVGYDTTAAGALAGGMGALSTLAAQAGLSDAPTAATIVKVAPSVEVESLVTDLNADPQVSYASAVPTRWAAVGLPPPLTMAAGSRAAAGSPLGWNLSRIGLPELAAEQLDASGVVVGVLDTGVDDAHPGLSIQAYSHGSGNTAVVSGQDLVGHGTHVVGTIANTGSYESSGLLGICKAPMMVWKIFDDQPDYVSRSRIYWYLVDPILYRSALADCVDKVDVLNLSIGGTQAPDPQEAALFRLLIDRGVVVVAAMGNERTARSPISYPAAIDGVIAVGATDQADEVAQFSNAGDHIALAAPGVSILSTLPTYPGQMGYRASGASGRPMPGTPFPRGTVLGTQDGTSMAAPHVSAAVALLQANSPNRRTPQDARDLLMITASRTPGMGAARWTRDLGAGRLDPKRLIFAAERL